MRYLNRSVPYLAALIAGTLLLAGCPAPPTDHILIGGDSLTIQTAYAGHLPDFGVVAGLGWQAEDVHHGRAGHDGVAAWAEDPERSPHTLVVALGQNDAANGLDTTDRAQLQQLADATHPDTCVAWVLPWYTGTDPTRVAGINAYRTWAQTRGEPTVDWRPQAQAHPEYVDPDGIHLTPAGRAAYGQLIAQAVDSCG